MFSLLVSSFTSICLKGVIYQMEIEVMLDVVSVGRLHSHFTGIAIFIVVNVGSFCYRILFHKIGRFAFTLNKI